MFQEDTLIPFQPSHIPKGKYLVFAPHPDDEILGIGGTLCLAQQQNIPIHIVYMTSGELAGEPSEREQEARLVCEQLGATCEFLKWPDRHTQANFKRFNQVKEILNRIGANNVFLPSPMEFHIDHRTCASIVWRALQLAKNPCNVYCYEISRQSECNILIDISSTAKKKSQLINMYTSQISQNNYHDVCLALNKSRTYTLPDNVEYAEAFFKVNIQELPKSLFNRTTDNYFYDILPYERPIISILIRTYNRHELLSRCLESLTQQGYSDFLEVIIVNDGGDNPEKITASFVSKFKELKLINCPTNRGRAASANTALKHAQGEFVNFLDDDDTLKPNHIHSFLNAWRRDRTIKALYRGVNVLNDQEDIVHTYNEPYSQARLMHANYIPIHAVTFSREFMDMGLRFDENLTCYEDWDFWLQLSRLTTFKHITTITSNYHMQGDSLCSPHIQKLYDCDNHTQRLREKWQSKWTALEHNLVLSYFIQQEQKQFQNRIKQFEKELVSQND